MLSRRSFAAASALLSLVPRPGRTATTGKPALLGGDPVRRAPFPRWPVFNQTEERALLNVLASGQWFRGSGGRVAEFEEKYAHLTGSRFCLATANGTSALFTSLNALEVGPGDEVIVPPYTFVATVNAVLLQHALPVFVDSDIETSQMDARKLAPAITDRTRAIIPVHLGGSPADLDAILPLAAKRKVPVIEDACQAHLAEWKGKKVGALGDTGCFSFQASKNLNSGEGGAVLTQSEKLMDRCYAFHNNGRARRGDATGFTYAATGANLRLTPFQAALLMAQMTRLEEQARNREENARYLTGLLSGIPGITPARMYSGTTRNAYHLYMFRYHSEPFAGMPRDVFLKALRAEGIPCSGGYTPLNKEPFIERVLNSAGYKRLFPGKALAEWREKNACPANDALCEQAVWFTQTMLLGPRGGMDEIAAAVRKIQAAAPELKNA